MSESSILGMYCINPSRDGADFHCGQITKSLGMGYYLYTAWSAINSADMCSYVVTLDTLEKAGSELFDTVEAMRAREMVWYKRLDK